MRDESWITLETAITANLNSHLWCLSKSFGLGLLLQSNDWWRDDPTVSLLDLPL